MKRKVNVILSLLLALAICISGFSTTCVQAKSTNDSTFSLSVAAGAMIKGDTKKLSISPKKTKIKSFKSSNKNVISVNSKGKITALKSGTSTITAISKDGKKAKITIKVFKANSDMIVNRKIKGKKALWHIKNGKVVKKSGFATDGINWYYTQNGRVSNKTGIITGKVKNSKAKWYVKKGRVELTYTGAFKNWFVQKGKVDEHLNGTFFANGKTYKVNNGQIIDQVNGKIDAFFGDEVFLPEYGEIVIGDPNISIRTNAIYPQTGYADCTFIENGIETSFGLNTINNKRIVSTDSFIKNYVIEFVDVKEGLYIIKVSPRTQPIQKPMSISGNSTDHYTTNGYEYIESDNIIMFMNKGVKFDGNILKKLEEYIKAVEKETGLKRNNSKSLYSGQINVQNEIYGEAPFEGIDPEFKKLHIYINDKIHPQCFAPKDSYGYIALTSSALEVNSEGRLNTDFIHEYAHYVQLNNGPHFNGIVSEGFAAYTEINVARALLTKEQANDEYFYENYTLDYLLPRGTITKTNAESTFISGFPDGVEHTLTYNYGYVLMTYIHETYGKDGFKMLFTEGDKLLKKQLETSIESDLTGANTAELFKKVYSKTFFTDFTNWLEKHPEYEADITYSIEE